MSKIKVAVGEILTQYQKDKKTHVIRAQLLDADTRKQIDTFELVAIWTSYKKDRFLPPGKRQLKIKNKLRIKRKDKTIAATFSTVEGKMEKFEIVLKRLLAKDKRYELANI